MRRPTYRFARTILWVALALAPPLSSTTQAQTFLQVPLNLSNTGRAVNSSMAVGPAGDIDVVWLDSGAILFRRSVDGGQTFSATMTVATTNLPVASSPGAQPQIAVNSAGVYVAWVGNSANGGDIFFSSLMSGGTNWLSPPLNISNGSGVTSLSSAPVPHVTVEPTGAVDVAWGQNGAYFARSTTGTSFALPVQLTTSAMASASPRIAVNSAGIIYAVWESAGTCPAITVSRSTNAGATFTNYPVDDSLMVGGQPDTGCASDAQIAVGANNTVHLLWANETGTPTAIQDVIATYQTDNGSSFPGFATPQDEQGFQNLSSTASSTPEMAIDASGHIDVVWIGDYQENGGPPAVYFSRSTNGGSSFTSPQPLTSPPVPGLSTGFPQIVAEPSGATDILWQQASAANPSGAYDVVLARSTDGANFKNFTLDNAPTTAASTGQIAADGSGDVYAVWLGSSGSAGDTLINGDSTGIITLPPFSLSGLTASVSPASAVINVNGSASFTVTLKSTNSVAGSVGLACGAPAGMTCTFSPNPVSVPANGSASVTLNVSVSAMPSTSAAQRNPGVAVPWRPGSLQNAAEGRAWGIGFALFLVMLIVARHENSRIAHCARAVAWSLLLAAVVTVMVSCSGSTSSNTSGSGGGSVTVPVAVQAQFNSATANLQTISITVP